MENSTVSILENLLTWKGDAESNSQYNFVSVQESVSSHWQSNNIYKKCKEKVKNGKKFYFLDGPPYTSGKVHVGTAWNKSLKDVRAKININ